MTNTDSELIAELSEVLARQKYSAVVVGNYCCYARGFLDYLARRDVPVTTVTPPQVEQYLRYATQSFRKRHGRPPGLRWHAIPRAGIHALLRLAQGQWPPEPDVIGPDAMLRHAICCEYEAWLRDERGLATASDSREIFIRSRAPYHPLRNLYSEIRRRLSAAGVKPPGKCGPHVFRHARAVQLLRASVPQKVIGDMLGHRSTEATIPYLKLATEDLRAVALDVPGSGVPS